MVKPPPGPAARKTWVWLRRVDIYFSTLLNTLFIFDRFDAHFSCSQNSGISRIHGRPLKMPPQASNSRLLN